MSQEMAKLGFYNIVTIECLSREYTARKIGYNPIRPDQIPDKKVEEVKEDLTKAPSKKRQ